jgi:hypothetical protein
VSRESLRRGDLVEVRSPREIMATLDATGALGAMPFMAEMLEHCGRRYRVLRRTEKICDTITGLYNSRRLPDFVLLDDLRCSGRDHDGCQAMCRLYWHESWLRPVDPTDPPATDGTDGRDELAALLAPHTTTVDDEGTTRYRCQATETVKASEELAFKDPMPYLREATTRNVPLGHFVRVMARATVYEVRRKVGRLPNAVLVGDTRATPPSEILDLQPGEWVRVKSPEQIRARLNDQGRNRGLWFDREMLPFCGNVYQVLQRIDRIIDERTGQMVEFSSDCVVLVDGICSGELATQRWFCPRGIYSYWRECWLERAEAPAGSAAGTAVTAVAPP